MKKDFNKIFLIVVFIISFMNIASVYGLSNKGDKLQPQQLQLKSSDGNIVLLADLDSQDRVYNNFRIKIGNNEKRFNWKSIGSVSFTPSMRLVNLGNNKNACLVVFLIEAHGTGVFIQRLHVIKIDDFSEIQVEDPLGIIQNHVKTQSTNDSIIMDIDGNKTILDKNYLNKLGIIDPSQKLIYEYRIVYGVRDNNLFAEVGVSNESLTYIGRIYINYIYKNGRLEMYNMNFEKFS